MTAMAQNILQSLVSLTDQRNIESLEKNLPTTIAQILPVRSISIFKPIQENIFTEIEEVLSFLVRKKSPHYSLNAESAILKTSKPLKSCIKLSSVQECLSEDNSHREIYYPIMVDGKTIRVLRVECSILDKSQRAILDDITHIYKNYLTILNESEHDKLTSLLNRRTFDQRFNKLVSQQRDNQKTLMEEYKEPEKRHLTPSDKIYIAMMDIDHFKRVNDVYGHIYGDEILLLISTLMRKSFRNSDLLFRFGGEEFVILLEPTSQENAHSALERFREKVENYNFPQVGKLTISIGFSTVTDGHYATTSCDHADQALYHAKKNGRNRIYCFEKLVDIGEINYPNKTGSVELF